MQIKKGFLMSLLFFTSLLSGCSQNQETLTAFQTATSAPLHLSSTENKATPVTNLDPDSKAIHQLLQDYFGLMNEGRFDQAADLRVANEQGQVNIWNRNSFISTFESGAKVRYTLLDITDGHLLDNGSASSFWGNAVFPDENERDCKSFLVKYQLDFDGIIGYDPSGAVFTQKAVIHKQGDGWRIFDLVDPGFVTCRKEDGSWGQGNPTVTPQIETTPIPFVARTPISTPTLAPDLANLTAEETLIRYFDLQNRGDFDKVYSLLSTHSAYSKMGYREYLENQQQLVSIHLLLDLQPQGVCQEGAGQMPRITQVSPIPDNANCLIYSVKSQIFFQTGWGAIPSGSVYTWNYWLVRENGQWRIRDFGVG